MPVLERTYGREVHTTSDELLISSDSHVIEPAGLWQVPPPELSFATDHYDRLWAAAQEMRMPVNLHILSGHGYARERAFARPPTVKPAVDIARNSVNDKMAQAMDAMYDFIFSGVF